MLNSTCTKISNIPLLDFQRIRFGYYFDKSDESEYDGCSC